MLERIPALPGTELARPAYHADFATEFAEILPPNLAEATLAARLADPDGARAVLAEEVQLQLTAATESDTAFRSVVQPE